MSFDNRLEDYVEGKIQDIQEETWEKAWNISKAYLEAHKVSQKLLLELFKLAGYKGDNK